MSGSNCCFLTCIQVSQEADKVVWHSRPSLQLHCIEVKWSEVKWSGSVMSVTLCDPMDCSPPGSLVHGIFQAWIWGRVAISFSRGSSWPRDWTQVSCIVGRRFTIWATRELYCNRNSIHRIQIIMSIWETCFFHFFLSPSGQAMVSFILIRFGWFILIFLKLFLNFFYVVCILAELNCLS